MWIEDLDNSGIVDQAFAEAKDMYDLIQGAARDTLVEVNGDAEKAFSRNIGGLMIFLSQYRSDHHDLILRGLLSYAITTTAKKELEG